MFCRLGEYQDRIRDLGRKGLRLPAAASGMGRGHRWSLHPRPLQRRDDGASRYRQPHIVGGRAMAAHVHWGAAGGNTFINLYLDVELGLEGNMGRIWKVVEYIRMLNAR